MLVIILYVHDTCLPIFAPTLDVTFQNWHFRITVGIAFCYGLIFLSMYLIRLRIVDLSVHDQSCFNSLKKPSLAKFLNLRSYKNASDVSVHLSSSNYLHFTPWYRYKKLKSSQINQNSNTKSAIKNSLYLSRYQRVKNHQNSLIKRIFWHTSPKNSNRRSPP